MNINKEILTQFTKDALRNPFSVFKYSFFRYLLIGTTTFIIDFGIFNFMSLKMDVKPIVANLTSTFLSLFFNFSMSNFWTFKLGNSQQLKKLSRYAFLAVFNYIFGNVAMYGFIEYTDINHNLAKALITITVVAWNFLLYKKWVFKED